MENIPVYCIDDFLSDELCQKYIHIQPEKEKSIKKGNHFLGLNKEQEFLNLFKEPIKNYFDLLMEKQFVFPNQMEKKKIYITYIHVKNYDMNKPKKKSGGILVKNLFNFIIFLNDLENNVGGEFVFNHNTIVNCKKKTLVIFPNEWFYSVENKMPTIGEKICLEGQICIQ